MVEIWRWPKASPSVSTTVCIDTPSRPAVSRSVSTIMRSPLSCASEATSSSSGEALSRAASRAAQRPTSAASLPVSVYWNWPRLERVEIWMSCTGWK